MNPMTLHFLVIPLMSASTIVSTCPLVIRCDVTGPSSDQQQDPHSKTEKQWGCCPWRFTLRDFTLQLFLFIHPWSSIFNIFECLLYSLWSRILALIWTGVMRNTEQETSHSFLGSQSPCVIQLVCDTYFLRGLAFFYNLSFHCIPKKWFWEICWQFSMKWCVFWHKLHCSLGI